jgi:hypothetical protein
MNSNERTPELSCITKNMLRTVGQVARLETAGSEGRVKNGPFGSSTALGSQTG